MGDRTGIEWTDATWNPVTGCTKVSQGCKHCYAERVFARPYPGRAFTDVQTHPDRLDQPLRWRRPRRIFVNSMSDLFHEDVPDEFIDKVFAVMAMAHWHTFQVLTKRPERVLTYFREMRGSEARGFNVCAYFDTSIPDCARISQIPNGLPNVWLGVSVEDQAMADERIPLLMQTPAAVRWISAEPLLGPVDLTRIDYGARPGYHMDALAGYCDNGTNTRLDWIVCGGESGPHARPMHSDWARSLRDQCTAAGVPFLFKQWGEWICADQSACPLGPPENRWMWGDGTPFKYGDAAAGPEVRDGRLPLLCRIGKKTAGRVLDGRTWDEYPK